MDGLEISQKINDVMNILRINTGLARLYLKFRDTEKAASYLSNAEKLAMAANSYKDLVKINKIYSENCSISGNYKEAKVFMEKHNKYQAKLSNLSEENKIQAIMLGHIKNSFNNTPAYYSNPKREEVLSHA